MGKKSREKKQRKLQRRGLPGITRPLSPAPGSSAAEQALSERVRRGGEHYVQDNFIRTMRESQILRSEPEFRDLHFDLDETNEVSSRLMHKYEKQLPQVLKKGLDDRRAFYEQVRIEMIEELATPDWRRAVLFGLERLSQRLSQGREADKLEMALVLQSFLREKAIPWGLCGLVTAIYEDSAEKAHQQLEGDRAELEGIVKAAEREGNLERLLTQPESPEILPIVQRMKANPGLIKRLEQETDQEIRRFEQSIADGKVRLDLFTAEELERPYKQLADYVSRNRIDPATASVDELRNQLVENIRETIGGLMTKDRIKEMKCALNRLSVEWLRGRNWQAALLHAEIFWLESAQPIDNPFLYAAFVGQLKRWQDSRVESNTGLDASTEASTPSEGVFS